MNRKAWLTVGLSVLLGSGIASVAPVGATPATEHGARVQIVRWGDQGGEQGEVESPRWGDQGSEQGEVESPRWGDQGGEQGEVESPRAGHQGGDQTDAGAPRT